MLKTTASAFVLYFGMLVSVNTYFHNSMKPCPSFKQENVTEISKIMGKWNLVLILTDEDFDEKEEDSSCVNADFKRINDTEFIQKWYINSPHLGHGGAIIEFPTIIRETGEWIVTDPFGGHFQVNIIHSSKSHLSMVFCGEQAGKPVYLWTAVIRRERSQINILKIISELLEQGFNINDNKMLTWSKC